jgi:uncharacterized membrane protein YkvA (DUF1232 family)
VPPLPRGIRIIPATSPGIAESLKLAFPDTYPREAYFKDPFMRRLLGLWRMGGKDLGLLWFALRHPHRPGWLLPAIAVLGLYAADPFNFAIPLLGVLDDVVILPLLLHVLLKLLPAEIRSAYVLRSYAAR